MIVIFMGLGGAKRWGGRKVLSHNMDSASHKKGGPIFMGEIDPSRHHVNIRSEI